MWPYIQRIPAVQVGKWGNSLAVRLPAAVVEALSLKEGDDIAIEVASPRRLRIARNTSRDQALDVLRRLGWTLPRDYRFSRETPR